MTKGTMIMGKFDLRSYFKLLVFLTCIYLPNFSFTQWSYNIDTVHTNPQFPLPTDEIEVKYKIVTYEYATIENESFSINNSNDTITIDICLGLSALPQSLVLEDSINIGTLSEGNYHLLFNVHSSYTAPYCQPASDSGGVTLDFTVSMSNILIENNEVDIVIYPNPVSEILTINNFGNKVQKVTIFDIHGKVIKLPNINFDDNQNSIDLSYLKKGIYFLKIEVDGKIYHKKILKD